MGRVWIEGAHRESADLDARADLMGLYLMVANGLDGDIRIVGETPEAVAVMRGLLRGAGSCTAIEAPADAPLYRAGDECYRQHAEARAFLDPRARNREPPPTTPAAPAVAPSAPPPSSTASGAPAPVPPPGRREPLEELDALYARLRAAERAAGDLQAQIDHGHAGDADAASAALAAHDREAADALADLTRRIATLHRRAPDIVEGWVAGPPDERLALPRRRSRSS
jgi:hypothetical protein